MYAQTRPDTAMVVDDPGSTAAGTGAHPSSEAARRHLMDEASAHAEDGIDPFEAHRRAQGRGPSRIVDQEDEVRLSLEVCCRAPAARLPPLATGQAARSQAAYKGVQSMERSAA